jgi:hypothetical protein
MGNNFLKNILTNQSGLGNCNFGEIVDTMKNPNINQSHLPVDFANKVRAIGGTRLSSSHYDFSGVGKLTEED